ncbi:MAG: hypothetical protein EZS28_051852 [Streblomastix strix]|uniref:Uncharacterized protein n=1 Tax=Streblomastix strix TaxID=222440 RepID=A0A5J4T133_9EUKA|nr:MAG: hypothetical protein EZS28_051852 [Streblomastix strix]
MNNEVVDECDGTLVRFGNASQDSVISYYQQAFGVSNYCNIDGFVSDYDEDQDTLSITFIPSANYSSSRGFIQQGMFPPALHTFFRTNCA